MTKKIEIETHYYDRKEIDFIDYVISDVINVLQGFVATHPGKDYRLTYYAEYGNVTHYIEYQRQRTEKEMEEERLQLEKFNKEERQRRKLSKQTKLLAERELYETLKRKFEK